MLCCADQVSCHNVVFLQVSSPTCHSPRHCIFLHTTQIPILFNCLFFKKYISNRTLHLHMLIHNGAKLKCKYILLLVISAKPAVFYPSVVCFINLFHCLHSDVKQMDRVRLGERVGTFNSLTRVTMEALSAACLSVCRATWEPTDHMCRAVGRRAVLMVRERPVNSASFRLARLLWPDSTCEGSECTRNTALHSTAPRSNENTWRHKKNTATFPTWDIIKVRPLNGLCLPAHSIRTTHVSSVLHNFNMSYACSLDA